MVTLEYELKKYLDSKLTIDIKPSFGTGKFPIVTYNHAPISGGPVKQSQFEIKIIDDDLDRAIDLREKVNSLLDNGNAISTANIHLLSSLSGGGQLFNDSIQVWELSAIYIIKWRKK